jgi:hypothetical protein
MDLQAQKEAEVAALAQKLRKTDAHQTERSMSNHDDVRSGHSSTTRPASLSTATPQRSISPAAILHRRKRGGMSSRMVLTATAEDMEVSIILELAYSVINTRTG